MKKAYAVIGANFGDEGKGLMTDYFCRNNANTINIRTNGGAQAGHTVCTAKGERHVFSHIGAGYFAGADTYLSEFFIVNPMLFSKEKNILGDLKQKIFTDERCRLTLPCDMLLNQFAERIRDEKRHGSCGTGIFETITRCEIPENRILYGEIKDIPDYIPELAEKIKNINQGYCLERAENLGITRENSPEFFELLENENITLNYINDLFEMRKICRVCDEKIIENYETAVFEGAQGLLLDRDRKDYFPHLTPTNTGMKNIRDILNRLEKRDVEICYVTRSYFTRHGAGRFDTECKALKEIYNLYDSTNVTNEFQGNFRYGWFDLPEFMNSLKIDGKYAEKDKISIAVTHLDMTDGMVVCPTGKLMPEDIAYMARAIKVYKSFGETAEDIQEQEKI
ncbi:MAG: adenylosuccinate synthetase [Ruminococcus sp.]|nr:adenylosuccinate synthetase [Ruminococcus sp.]